MNDVLELLLLSAPVWLVHSLGIALGRESAVPAATRSAAQLAAAPDRAGLDCRDTLQSVSE
jgi:hypothetical protein